MTQKKLKHFTWEVKKKKHKCNSDCGDTCTEAEPLSYCITMH